GRGKAMGLTTTVNGCHATEGMGEGEEPVHPERLPSQHLALARSSGPLTRYRSTCPCVIFGSTQTAFPTDTIRTKRKLLRRAFPLLHGGGMGRPLVLLAI